MAQLEDDCMPSMPELSSSCITSEHSEIVGEAEAACPAARPSPDEASLAGVKEVVTTMHSSSDVSPGLGGMRRHTFVGEWDEEGVFFYQAFNTSIADWAVENQKFGGPDFNPQRMTWIKPSFAWVLYRAGYGHKDKNQARILKIKLPHHAVAELLSRCITSSLKHDRENVEGRIQWDPARSLLRSEGGEPGRDACLYGGRAIQIGMKGDLSRYYVEQALSIEDVTHLSHAVHDAHALSKDDCQVAIQQMLDCHRLPNERPYLPQCAEDVLIRLEFWRGE